MVTGFGGEGEVGATCELCLGNSPQDNNLYLDAGEAEESYFVVKVIVTNST